MASAGVSGSVPAVVHSAADSYVHDFDTTVTGNMSTMTELGEGQSKDVTSRLKAKARCTPTGTPLEFLMQLEESLEVFGTAGNGLVAPQE